MFRIANSQVLLAPSYYLEDHKLYRQTWETRGLLLLIKMKKCINFLEITSQTAKMKGKELKNVEEELNLF